MSRFGSLLAAAVLAAGLAGPVLAQAPGAAAPAPAAPALADDPPPPGTGGIQGQNIFDVKPEVKPDASSLPGYMEQNNAQRNAVQPGNNAPMWRGVQSGTVGFSSLPRSQAPEAGVLIQAPTQYVVLNRPVTAGEAWRQVRNTWIVPYGGALLLIVVVALAIFFFTKGPMGHADASGVRRIERFTPFERAAHWVNAIAFCVLAISGIIMALGKFFLLPVIGQTLFGYFTYVLKNVHNFVGPLFVVSLAVVIFVFARDNLPQRGDGRWMLRLGGILGKKEVPSHRYNAGEKLVFWIGTLLLGVIVTGSGLVLDMLIPGLVYERSTMQVANMVHGVSAFLMMAMFLGHIYMGTVGMRGAYRGMRDGYVSDEWAREHHELWHEDIRTGRVPAQRSQPPAVVGDTPGVRPV